MWPSGVARATVSEPDGAAGAAFVLDDDVAAEQRAEPTREHRAPIGRPDRRQRTATTILVVSAMAGAVSSIAAPQINAFRIFISVSPTRCARQFYFQPPAEAGGATARTIAELENLWHGGRAPEDAAAVPKRARSIVRLMIGWARGCRHVPVSGVSDALSGRLNTILQAGLSCCFFSVKHCFTLRSVGNGVLAKPEGVRRASVRIGLRCRRWPGERRYDRK